MHVVPDVPPHRHVVDLLHERDDAREGLSCVHEVLLGAVPHERVELPVRERFWFVERHALGERRHAQEGEQLLLDDCERMREERRGQVVGWFVEDDDTAPLG